jgi:Bacterial Ig domain
VGTDTSAPYSFSYNTRSLPNGAKVLTAKAYDTWNNVGTSAPVNVTFDNDFTAPTTSITSPASGSTVTGVVQIDAIADDDRGTITKVDFYQGSVLLGSRTTAPYNWAWDSTRLPTGSITLKTRAWDAAGNSAYSTAVTVTVAR